MTENFPPELLKSVSIKPLSGVIKGEISYLSYAFVWESTPHGRDYWEEISTRDRILMPADQTFLEELLLTCSLSETFT